MPAPSAFLTYRDELERSEFQRGPDAGRLAVALDLLTDALVLSGQHGVYCRSARGGPARDIELISTSIEQAKELLASVLLRLDPAAKRP